MMRPTVWFIFYTGALLIASLIVGDMSNPVPIASFMLCSNVSDGRLPAFQERTTGPFHSIGSLFSFPSGSRVEGYHDRARSIAILILDPQFQEP